jgi:hypothetical protein
VRATIVDGLKNLPKTPINVCFAENSGKHLLKIAEADRVKIAELGFKPKMGESA